MKNLKIHNSFKFEKRTTLSEARSQAMVMEKIEKLTELADTYNFNEEPLTLRLFGDLRSGLSFAIECDNKNT